MFTADINGSQSRQRPGANGTCPFCCSEMIARCDEVRVHHSAHKSKSDYDRWWEPETDWHRNWKNEFPLRWQVRILLDQTTNEKHIADVLNHGDNFSQRSAGCCTPVRARVDACNFAFLKLMWC